VGSVSAAPRVAAGGPVTTRSAAGTTRLGERLGGLLEPGHLVALVGDLGAGKTRLVRGICAGAGVTSDEVTSPSFAIVQTYAGRLPVHHADLYRLADLDELFATGFMDLVGGPGALLVEWADRIQGWLPAEHLVVRLCEVAGRPSWRQVSFAPGGPRHAALAAALLAPPGRRPPGR
jgi:tRNA threonylcarbamoyladenosine biosynthesis protein TsaE